MTTLAPAAQAIEYDPLRDKTYQRARLGPDVAAFLAWLELGGASPITVDNYERALAVVCRMYPLTPIDQITDGQLAQVFKRFPARSRRVRVAPYRTFFKWAVTSHRIRRGENPMELIPMMRRQPRRQPEVFSPAEVDALLSLDVVDAAPLAVLFDAGLRRAELIGNKERDTPGLLLRHCRPESGYVKVIDGKGGKDRMVPMSNRLRALIADLELLEALGPNDHILYRVQANAMGSKRLRDRRVGEGTFARWWRRCLDDAGVRYRKPHVARHTFATTWRRRGLELDDLALVMGHESIRTTSDLYAQRTAEDASTRMAEIEAMEAIVTE